MRRGLVPFLVLIILILAEQNSATAARFTRVTKQLRELQDRLAGLKRD